MSWDNSPRQKAKKLRGGQQDQGHEVVHHDQGGGYQQPKSFRSGNGSVPQGGKEVSQLGPKFNILFKNRSNTIPWA